jgi:FKBP-type peptidyl-prolyl cis-trans isomerase FkpA
MMKKRNRYINWLFVFLIFGAVVASCKKDEVSDEEQAKIDDEVIQKYLAEKNLTAEKTASGLYYIIHNQGEGKKPASNDNVRVRYKGYFTDGKVFDQSQEAGITFNLQQVIKGWTEGIPLFNEGGNGILLIPSHLGYGVRGSSSGTIPGRTVILFDVMLLEVNP